MYTIREIPYEESRRRFFEKLIKRQEQKIRYWQSPIKEPERARDEISKAGEIISYCRDAIEATEKKIPKKPEKFINDYDILGKIKGYRTVCCGIALRVRHDNGFEPIDYFCPNCGQEIDWSDEE